MSFGLLIKLTIAFIIISYLWKKVGKFFINIFTGNAAQSSTNQRKQQGATNTKSKPVKNHEKKFTAGDYVDYEEVD